MPTTNINQLDPENVKKAIELSSVEEVNKRLSDAGVVGAQAPAPTPTTTPIKTPEVDTPPAPIQAEEVVETTTTPPMATGAQSVGAVTGTSIKGPGTTDDITETETPAEPTKIEKVAEVPTITNISEFKAAGADIDDLTNLIEYAYGKEGDVVVRGDTIYGTKNGIPTKWIIDDAGNPIATAITKDQARQEGADLGPNLSAGDVFNAFMTGATDGLDESTSEYTIAKRRFNNFNSLDKSEDGMYTAIKAGTFDYSIVSELNKTPEYQEALASANARIVREQLDNTAIEDVIGMSSMSMIDFTKQIMIKFGLDENYADKYEQNENLQEYKDGYLEANKAYLKDKKELDALKTKIKAQNPNGSPAYLNALYNREAQALIQSGNDNLAEAGAYLGSYELETGEMKTIIDLQNAQNDKQFSFYSDLLSTQHEQFVDTREYNQTLDSIKANKQSAQNFSFQNLGSGVGISYNKQTGEYEYIDINNIPTGDNVDFANGSTMNSNGISFSTSDYLKNKYPNEASVKNNNPAGLTSGVSKTLQGLWKEAGIEWGVGTPRPESEGGNYIGFNTVQDGLKAYEIALTQRGDNVFSRLEQWVGTSNSNTNYEYAQNILDKAGVALVEQKSLKWSDLNSDTKDKIMTAQLEQESPGFLAELKELGISKQDGTFDFNAGKTSDTATPKTDTQIAADIGGITVEIFGSRASDGERGLVTEIVKGSPGMNRDDIIQTIKGFTFDNEDQTVFAKNLLSKVRIVLPLADIDLPGIASFVRTGNYGGAIKKAEKLVTETSPDKEIRESKVRYTIERVNQLQDLISKGEELIGPAKGTLQEWMERFKGEGASELQGRITELVADMRNRLSGTAVTESETLFLEPLIPALHDRPDTMVNKINRLKTVPFEQLNALRNELGLPSITEDMVGNLNFDDRVGLYGKDIVYTSKGGVGYSSDEINKQLNEAIDSGKLTADEARRWYINNIKQ